MSNKTTANLATLLKSQWIPSREPDCDQIDKLGKQLEKYWQYEVKTNGRRKASLSRAILQTFGPSFCVCAFWEIVAKCLFGILVAIILGLLIGDIQVYINETRVAESLNETIRNSESENFANESSHGSVFNSVEEPDKWAFQSIRTQIIVKSIILFFCLCANISASQYYLFHSTYNGMKVRIAVTYLIYRKALKISLLTLETTTSGQIINLITNDVNKYDSAFYYLQYMYIAPLHTVVIFIILGNFYLGAISILIGASIVTVYLIGQIYMGSLYGHYKSESANRTDDRVRSMGELIDSISIIKMYAWEEYFEKNIERLRNLEMGVLKKVLTLRAINLSLFYGACKLILMIMFVAYVMMGNKFNAIVIFTALTLTNSMRSYLTLFFPYSIAQFSEIQVSTERIRQFLIQDELRPPPRPPSFEPLLPPPTITAPLETSLSTVFSGNTSLQPVVLNQRLNIKSTQRNEKDSHTGKQSPPDQAEARDLAIKSSKKSPFGEDVHNQRQSHHIHSLKTSQSLQKWHDKRRLSFITPQSAVQSPELLNGIPEQTVSISTSPISPSLTIHKQSHQGQNVARSFSMTPLFSYSESSNKQGTRKAKTRNPITPFRAIVNSNASSPDGSCRICAKFDNNHLLIDKKFAIIFHEVSVAWPKTTPPEQSNLGQAINTTSNNPLSSIIGLSVPPNTLGESSPFSTLANQTTGQATIFNNLTAHIKHHEFVMIVGRVGSGKSSLLMTLLNELPIQSGSIRINGSLSYASQEPWLFSGTIRENITIAWHRRPGRDYRRMPDRLERRYREVLRICCLDRDISMMPYGELTNVGERGLALSGGQRARINLARALFYDADIYLLDDPLSAVDSAVAKYIFEECFRTFLKKKTVLLVTHQVQFSTPAQKVLLLYESPHFSYGPATKVLQNLYKKFNLDPKSAIPTGTHEEQKLVQVAVNEEPRRSAPVPEAKILIRSESKSSKNKDNERTPMGEIETGSLIKSLQSDELLQGVNSHEDENILEQSFNNKVTTDSDASSIATSLGTKVGKNKEQVLPDSERTIKQTPSQKNPAAVQSPSLLLLAEPSVASDADNPADCETFSYYQSRAAAIWLIVLFLFANVSTQILFNGTDYYLSAWSSNANANSNSMQSTLTEPLNRSIDIEKDDARSLFNYTGGYVLPLTSTNRGNSTSESSNSGFWSHLDLTCGVYLMIIILLLSASFARNMIFFRSCFNASTKIHQETLNGVLYAPMSFFERNSMGSILARFSTDLATLDDDIPQTAIDVIEITTNVIGIILVTAFVSWYNLVPAVGVILVADYWRRSSSEAITRLKQIEAMKKGRVFSRAISTLHGLTTIRVFHLEPVINRRFEGAQNDHTHAWYSFLAGRHRLTVAIDSSCMVYFLTLIIITIIMVFQGVIEASLVGLLVSQVIILPGPLQWGARQLTELQSLMTSLVRIRDYASTLRHEQDVMSKPKMDQPPEGWPQKGAITYDQVTLSYATGADVLHNISFEVKPGERVGIVGRTGAGKSSIISALFRMADFRGRIFIDGIDTKHVSLKHLRSNISIIPQEPILFTGTLRANLDPFGQHKDDSIWQALQSVRLKKLIAELDGGLGAQVVEGGHNFSAGQRQLICLARAILRRNIILVLDEATANVDPETDAFIQSTIREKFYNCTVLTIAHRLHTIMDSDKVLVLDSSQVREFDEPYELLKKPDGHFSKMVTATGSDAEHLRKIATAMHEERNRLSKLRDEMRAMMTAITTANRDGGQSQPNPVAEKPDESIGQQQEQEHEQKQQQQQQDNESL